MATPFLSRRTRTGPVTGAPSSLTTGSWRRTPDDVAPAAHRADGQAPDAGPFLVLAVERLRVGRGVSGQQAEDLLRRTAAVQDTAVHDMARHVVLLGDLPAGQGQAG